MGQINLYKIDGNSKDDFFDKLYEKFQCIGEQDYQVNGVESIYTVGTYVDESERKRTLDWQWILDEYDYTIDETKSSPRAVLVIESEAGIYAVTYGLSYFVVDKYCDTNFAFDFARRIKFKQIKTTTLTAPNAQRNKIVNVYLNYNDLSFDSGESYAKIKAKAEIEEGGTVHDEMLEIGHSIKTKVSENSIESIIRFIEYVEVVRKRKELQKIPVFSKVTDKKEIQMLNEDLLEKIDNNINCINISELDIIGVNEIFNNNDTVFTLKYNRKSQEIQDLTKETILDFMKKNGLNIKEHFLDIKVISNKNGDSVRTDIMKQLIDYTDDERKCLLLKGEWYFFNDDYIEYLQNSIAELEVIYEPEYDFSNEKKSEYIEQKVREEKDYSEYKGLPEEEMIKKISSKYYTERVFNNVLSEKFGYENHDRTIEETGGGKIELMDLYKNKTMFAVKIGNSSEKLSYVVEQSIIAAKMYKQKYHLHSDMPEIENIAIWIVLRGRKHLPKVDGKPDISSLNMIMFKNRLDAWKKEIRLLGYTPKVYLNYWDE